jgi:1-acyl-sn-glycerol-3-phosphate acyltransferase
MQINTVERDKHDSRALTTAQTASELPRRDLRSILLTGTAIVITGIGIICAFISLIFDRSAYLCHSVVARCWARALLRLFGVRVDVEGADNFDPKGLHVFMSNHQSHLDICAILGFLPAQVRFIAKKELYKIPFFGLTLRAIGHISIDRDDHNRALASYDRAAERIRRGTSVFIFAEGTRSPDGTVGPFKKGGFILAVKAGVPIVPITISGGRKLLPKQKLVFRRGVMKMVVGTPIDTDGYQLDNKEELIERVRDVIIGNLKEDEVVVLSQRG